MSRVLRPVLHAAWVPLIGAVAGGITLGAAAKLADQAGITGLADLGTYLGAWILIATLIAAWSPSRLMAALRVGAFLLAMVCTYYAVTQWLFGLFPTSYFITWAVVAVLPAPLFAALLWQSRQTGWVAAFAAALPVGLLLAEAFSFRWVLPRYIAQFVFDIAAAALLLWVLPRDWPQRTKALIVLPAVLLAAIGAHQLIPHIAGILHTFGLRL